MTPFAKARLVRRWAAIAVSESPLSGPSRTSSRRGGNSPVTIAAAARVVTLKGAGQDWLLN